MTKEAFEKSLRSFQKRKPFKPFMIELTSGSTLQINHPEAVATYAGAAVHLSPDRDYTMFDADRVAKVMDVPKVAKAR